MINKFWKGIRKLGDICIIIESGVDGSKQIHVVGYDEGGEDLLDRYNTIR